jgi:DNA polymerase-3 subunit chi
MPQVDFYILHTQGKLEKERFACRLIDKVWHQGFRIFVQTDSFEQAKQLDDFLWTFKQDSFIPHTLYSEAQKTPAPIYLGYDEQFDVNSDVLLNLAESVPSFFDKFQRIAECVGNTSAAREAGRTRYRFYKESANELKSHDIYR